MNNMVMVCVGAILMCCRLAYADADADTSRAVLSLERQVMDGWLNGNPDSLIALSDPDITYFHSILDKRLDGIKAVKDLYEGYRGRPLYDSYKMVDPKVQAAGDLAILTYQLETHNGDLTRYWNATVVYQKKQEGWRIIHTHWSLTKPTIPGAPKEQE